jgi:acyl carrier protein
MTAEKIDAGVRRLLARVMERDPGEVASLPESTPLFGEGVALDSLSGLELLAGVQQEFGVDIAAEDLNLDSLQTIGTLVSYLSGHRDTSQSSR